MPIRPPPPVRQQRGVFLLEALIGILVFSLGILAMVALQATTISIQTDAQYRVEAANLANQLIGEISSNVDRSSDASLQAAIAGYAHHASGEDCNSFSGAASSNTTVTNWLTRLARIPGATEARQQIRVTTGTFNQVRVSVCWQTPTDAQPHRYQIISYIN